MVVRPSAHSGVPSPIQSLRKVVHIGGFFLHLLIRNVGIRRVYQGGSLRMIIPSRVDIPEKRRLFPGWVISRLMPEMARLRFYS